MKEEKETPTVEPKQKNNTGLIVLLSIIIACLLLVIGFLVGTNYNKETKESKTETKEEKRENKKDKDEIKVDDEKINEAINNFMVFEYRGQDMTVKDLTNSDLINFAYDKLAKGNPVPLKDAQALTKKVFGVKVQPGKSICYACDSERIIFDSDKQAFVYSDNHPGHGGGGGIVTINKVDSIDVEDDIVTVTVKKIFSEFVPDTGYNFRYYYNYDAMIQENEDLLAYLDVDEEDAEMWLGDDVSLLKKIPNDVKNINFKKASTYEYKFQIDEDGNYVFKSYKKIKS